MFPLEDCDPIGRRRGEAVGTEDSSTLIDDAASAKINFPTASCGSRLLEPETRVGIVANAPIVSEIPCDTEKECGEDDGVAISIFETVVSGDGVDADDNRRSMSGRGILAAFESTALALSMILPGN